MSIEGLVASESVPPFIFPVSASTKETSPIGTSRVIDDVYALIIGLELHPSDGSVCTRDELVMDLLDGRLPEDIIPLDLSEELRQIRTGEAPNITKLADCGSAELQPTLSDLPTNLQIWDSRRQESKAREQAKRIRQDRFGY